MVDAPVRNAFVFAESFDAFQCAVEKQQRKRKIKRTHGASTQKGRKQQRSAEMDLSTCQPISFNYIHECAAKKRRLDVTPFVLRNRVEEESAPPYNSFLSRTLGSMQRTIAGIETPDAEEWREKGERNTKIEERQCRAEDENEKMEEDNGFVMEERVDEENIGNVVNAKDNNGKNESADRVKRRKMERHQLRRDSVIGRSAKEPGDVKDVMVPTTATTNSEARSVEDLKRAARPPHYNTEYIMMDCTSTAALSHSSESHHIPCYTIVDLERAEDAGFTFVHMGGTTPVKVHDVPGEDGEMRNRQAEDDSDRKEKELSNAEEEQLSTRESSMKVIKRSKKSLFGSRSQRTGVFSRDSSSETMEENVDQSRPRKSPGQSPKRGEDIDTTRQINGNETTNMGEHHHSAEMRVSKKLHQQQTQ